MTARSWLGFILLAVLIGGAFVAFINRAATGDWGSAGGALAIFLGLIVVASVARRAE